MVKQSWNPQSYTEQCDFVSRLGAPAVELLDPVPGERILDLGCGDGTLATKLQELGAEVLAVDSSPEMVAAAKQRGLDAHVVDGQALSFSREFDAVFSNAALHWMVQPELVVNGVARALRPGGRFVGEFGGHGNVAAIVTALLAAAEEMNHGSATPDLPWYFPTAEEYTRLLVNYGFEVTDIRLLPRPTRLEAGMAVWLETFAGPFKSRLPQAEHSRYLQRVERLVEPSLCDSDGNWTADYVRLRFRAVLPGE